MVRYETFNANPFRTDVAGLFVHIATVDPSHFRRLKHKRSRYSKERNKFPYSLQAKPSEGASDKLEHRCRIHPRDSAPRNLAVTTSQRVGE